MAQRQLDQPGVAAVERAQQMDRIGEVARRRRAARGGEAQRMAVPGKPDLGDPRRLSISNVQHRSLDCLKDRHCSFTPVLAGAGDTTLGPSD